MYVHMYMARQCECLDVHIEMHASVEKLTWTASRVCSICDRMQLAVHMYYMTME